MTQQPQFLLTAPASGSGKTSIAMGLMKLFSTKGYRVQPYKCGPDYIDTKFHAWACGTPSVNLDTFMATEAHVQQTYARYASGADICITEGMMGMFDGYDRWQGSSAAIARLLRIPVVLVVDAKATAYSVAPLIYGFARFQPDIRVAGVIFNRVGSPQHAKMLREACADARVDCLGCIPKNTDLSTGERYLGLDFSQFKGGEYMNRWAEMVEKYMDIDLLEQKTTIEKPVFQPLTEQPCSGLRIAVARNQESFSFIYTEMLDQLHGLGTVLFFDPETDAALPGSVNLLYLPGGYPEKHAAALATNAPMIRSIREYIETGGRTLAECGGMVYLSRGIAKDGKTTEMAGIFPFVITDEDSSRRLSLGYRKLLYNGLELRGHEFHYTQVSGESTPYPSAAQLYNAKGEPVTSALYRYKNVLAGYTHLYLGETDIMKLWNNL